MKRILLLFFILCLSAPTYSATTDLKTGAASTFYVPLYDPDNADAGNPDPAIRKNAYGSYTLEDITQNAILAPETYTGDLDAITANSINYVTAAGVTNEPSGWLGVGVLVTHFQPGSTSYGIQALSDISTTNGVVYRRTKQFDSWGSWITVLNSSDVDDTPVNGASTVPASSNWAYTHTAAADPHTGYMLESNIGVGPNNYVQLTASGEVPFTLDVGSLTDTGGLLTHTDTNAIHGDTSAEISALTEKASPVSGDWLIIEDSEAANAKKKVQAGSLPGSGSAEGTTNEVGNPVRWQIGVCSNAIYTNQSDCKTNSAVWTPKPTLGAPIIDGRNEYVYVWSYDPACSTDTLQDSGYSLSQAQAKYPNAGVTDETTMTTDTAAYLQAVYDAQQAGKAVHAPACTLHLSETVTHTSSSLIGYGAALSAITSDIDDTFVVLNGSQLEALGVSIYSSDKDGKTSQVGLYVGDPAGVAAPSGNIVENVYFHELYTGLELGSATSFRYAKNRAYANYYDIKVNNILDSDQGDTAIVDSHFTDEVPASGYAHLYVEQGSGFRVANNKFIKGNRAIDIAGVATTASESLLQVSNNSFEAQETSIITVDTVDETPIFNIQINGNEIYPKYNSITGISLTDVSVATIVGNMLMTNNTTGNVGIDLNNVKAFYAGSNTFYAIAGVFASGIDVDSSSSGFIGPNNFDSTVTADITNASASVGTLGTAAYADKSGADAAVISGTPGTNGNCVEWNADGDIVDAGGPCGTSSGMSQLSDDTSPILGGHLDVGGYDITSSTNGNIVIDPNGTGGLFLGGDSFSSAFANFTNSVFAESLLRIPNSSGGGVAITRIDGAAVGASELLGYYLVGGSQDGGTPAIVPNTGGIMVYSTDAWTGSSTPTTLHLDVTNTSGSRYHALTINPNGSLTSSSLVAGDTVDYVCVNSAGLLYASNTACE